MHSTSDAAQIYGHQIDADPFQTWLALAVHLSAYVHWSFGPLHPIPFEVHDLPIELPPFIAQVRNRSALVVPSAFSEGRGRGLISGGYLHAAAWTASSGLCLDINWVPRGPVPRDHVIPRVRQFPHFPPNVQGDQRR